MTANQSIQVFISYRREDTEGFAIALNSELIQRFGEQSIFMDLDNIAPGARWADVITDTVGSCDVLIALIGKRWLTVRDAQRNRRLDDPKDWVRLELEAALDRQIIVIPTLLQGAAMPRPAQLPESLQALTDIQALAIGEAGWKYGVARLLEQLDLLAHQKEQAEDAARETSPRAGSQRPAPSTRRDPTTDPARLSTPRGTRHRATSQSTPRHRFVEELKRRGWGVGDPYMGESSPNIYYADNNPHKKPRIVIRGTRIRVEKRPTDTSGYELWQSFSLEHEADTVLKIVNQQGMRPTERLFYYYGAPPED